MLPPIWPVLLTSTSGCCNWSKKVEDKRQVMSYAWSWIAQAVSEVTLCSKVSWNVSAGKESWNWCPMIWSTRGGAMMHLRTLKYVEMSWLEWLHDASRPQQHPCYWWCPRSRGTWSATRCCHQQIVHGWRKYTVILPQTSLSKSWQSSLQPSSLKRFQLRSIFVNSTMDWNLSLLQP